MKDFMVRMARYEEILIRADSAMDAAQIACQFPMDSWEDKFELCVEAANDKADRGEEVLKYPGTEAKGKKSKKKNRRWKCLCEDYCSDDDIPF